MGDQSVIKQENQALNQACTSIAALVKTREYQAAPWLYFQQIIDILNEHSIIPDTLTPLERNQLMGSFKVENVVDNIGTSSAITTYILSMLMIRQGQNLGGFAYNTITGVGMLFSFGCALSFTSSSFDLLQEYRRVHFRLKLVEYHQAYMMLMLRLWLESLPDTEYATQAPIILDLLQKMSLQQIEDLKRESETLQLLQSSEFLGNDYDEYERVAKEIADIDTEITMAQHNIKKIHKIDPNKRKSNTLSQDLSDHQHRINDILHRPLYDVGLNEKHEYGDSVSSRYGLLSSTSLYAKRYGHLKNLAAYNPFTASNTDFNPATDAELAEDFLSDENRIRFNIPAEINKDSRIFIGCLELYRSKQEKLKQYQQYPAGSKKPSTYLASLQIQYLQIQQELEIIDRQIEHHEDELNALNVPIQPSDQKATPAVESVSIETKELSLTPKTITLKPFAPRTAFMWKAEWEELKGFFLLVKEGFSIGVNQMMTPDEEKFQFRTQVQGYSAYHPRLWTYHIKQRIAQMSTGKKKFATSLFVLASIPYFIYYACKHFSHLLDGLQTVVDGIHKPVRDLDRALSYRSGDRLWFVLTYPLKVAWALITFIPETLGGMAYWALTAIRSLLMTSNYTVAHTSHAINPSWLANWVEKEYLAALQYKQKDKYIYNIAVAGLYVVTLLGGVYNTVATFIKKIIPFYPTHDEHIRASRDQLKIGGRLFTNAVIAGYRYLIEDPITSAFKQSQDEHVRAQAHYPFKKYPLTSSALHIMIALKFMANFILNVILLGTYRSIKGLAKTAPVITATVVVSSTLMPGISLPFFSFSFVASTQMKLAVLSMCGDCTNGSHDMYNLANSLKRRHRLRFIEHAALSMMKDKTSLDEYKYWIAFFEHVEVGALLFETMKKTAEQDTKPDTYVDDHCELVLTKRSGIWIESAQKSQYETIARQLLAHYLAKHCIDSADQTRSIRPETYEEFYNYLLNNDILYTVAQAIAARVPKNTSLSPEQCINYIAGLSVLAGYDFSRTLMGQLRDNYLSQNRVKAHQVNLDKGLCDLAQNISQAPKKTCLFSRAAPMMPRFSPQSLQPQSQHNAINNTA